MENPGEQTSTTARPSSAAPQPQTLREKLTAGRFVVSVEVDPPHGLVPDRALAGASLLQQANVDCINIGDSPLKMIYCYGPAGDVAHWRQELEGTLPKEGVDVPALPEGAQPQCTDKPAS